MKEVYYKGTRKGGVSFYDRNFVFHLGLNVHPNPDKNSATLCGEGIHLAKSLVTLKDLCPRPVEIYEARAGVILAEDNIKVRVAYCFLDKLISTDGFPTVLSVAKGIPICGQDWLNRHASDISQADIDNLKLEVISDKHKFKVGLSMKAKDRKYLLKQVVKG